MDYIKKIWRGVVYVLKVIRNILRYYSTKLYRKINTPRFWKAFFSWGIRVVALLLVVGAVAFIIISRQLPDPNQFLTRDVQQSTKIYDRDGGLLYQVGGDVKRTVIPFSQMTDNEKDSTIAIEDKNFYKEGGISIRGIARSIFVDLFSLSASQGGSTITQEFVRNAVLTQQKTIIRKVKEVILSIELDKDFSKDQILALYLNEIPYGRNAYGIEAAAQAYYGTDAQNLDLAQSAYLAAMIQAPSHYDPLGPYRQELDDRKNSVLDLMQQQGYITASQRDAAKSETVTFEKSSNPIKAPHFVFYIENYLEQKYGSDAVQNGGLQVYTTLDPTLQADAEQAINDYSASNEKKYNADNEALVAIDPNTGQVLAFVGSKDYFGDPEPAGCTPGTNCTFEPNVDVATSLRQAGSSMKPYVYGTAFEQPYDEAPATMRLDVDTDFGNFGGTDYEPRDYDLKQRGPTDIRNALAGSLNIPAVKTLSIIGVPAATKTMQEFGITTPLSSCSLSLVLGGCEVTLLDHTSGYATFATEGVHHQESAILKITDDSGNVLEQYQDQSSQVMDPQAAYEVDSILTDNAARTSVFGANSPMHIAGRTVAAKTGTTQNFRDGWTMGFTPSLAAGVWAGNNDGELLKSGSDGVVVAAPIWHDFMVKALGNTPDQPFAVPPGITTVTVDALTGLLPTQYTPSTKQDIFASYAVPTQYDNAHIPASQTACAQYNDCPPSGVYTIIRSEQPNLPNWEDPVEAWAQANGYTYPPGDAVFNPQSGAGGGTPVPPTGTGNPPAATILSPNDGDTVQQPFSVVGEGTPDQSSGATITEIDLLIDGSTAQTSSGSANSTFTISGLATGQHTIALHVIDSDHRTDDTSITVTVK